METSPRVYALVGIDDEDDAEEIVDETSAEEDDASDALALITSAPGNVSLESMMTEICRLASVRPIELPPGLPTDVAAQVPAGSGGGGGSLPRLRQPCRRRGRSHHATAVPSSSTIRSGIASRVTPSIVVDGATPAAPNRDASTP